MQSLTHSLCKTLFEMIFFDIIHIYFSISSHSLHSTDWQEIYSYPWCFLKLCTIQCGGICIESSASRCACTLAIAASLRHNILHYCYLLFYYYYDCRMCISIQHGVLITWQQISSNRNDCAIDHDSFRRK